MINFKDLQTRPEIYKLNIQKRGGNPSVVDICLDLYENWKNLQQELDTLRAEKNLFNQKVVNLSGEEKALAVTEMKTTSEKIKNLELQTKELKTDFDENLKKIPSLMWENVPIGKSDEDNPVLQIFGIKTVFEFEPKPYYELEVYQKYVGREEGVNAMGSRGYYIRGELARLQRVLFNWVYEYVLSQGLESFYVPLMLNDKILTGTGHLPDFDGQQYEVKIDENKSFYLIGSSEPSIMGYYYGKHLGTLQSPELLTCHSSCFRKEAGSYGKDQQGIFRVHQFEKIEMVAICKPEEAEHLFQKFGQINEHILKTLNLYFQKVEICSGDMPAKHYRQQDYEVWFPTQNKFREVASNGNASDYQNRGLDITYTDQNGQKVPAFGLNCTAITQRTMLAILENFQTVDGLVKIPDVLIKEFKKEYLE